MTENLENTQPTQMESTQPSQPLNAQQAAEIPEDAQPTPPVGKKSRWRSFFTGLLGFLLLVGLGGYGGYAAGINDRTRAESAILSKQLLDQYQRALVEIEFGQYDTARQRLEFILSKDPTFPGVAEKLTEILVKSVVPTVTPTLPPTATLDVSGVENAYLRAQQLVAAQDWQNAVAALDIVRKLDPNYKTAQVDGMYYFSLRNLGLRLIQQGNLEGGIYQLSLAERFGPLDNEAVQMREGARAYIIGASFWEINWQKAAEYFAVTPPNIWDGSMTAAERLNTAYARYGDFLFEQNDVCPAYDAYSRATTLDEKATWRMNKAYVECYPPTPVPEVPLEVPTDTPSP